jgi:hypothetical protein
MELKGRLRRVEQQARSEGVILVREPPEDLSE